MRVLNDSINLVARESVGGVLDLYWKSFGVNLITMHPMLSELIDVCAKHEVSHVVLAGGLVFAGAVVRAGAFAREVSSFML